MCNRAERCICYRVEKAWLFFFLLLSCRHFVSTFLLWPLPAQLYAPCTLQHSSSCSPRKFGHAMMRVVREGRLHTVEISAWWVICLFNLPVLLPMHYMPRRLSTANSLCHPKDAGRQSKAFGMTTSWHALLVINVWVLQDLQSPLCLGSRTSIHVIARCTSNNLATDKCISRAQEGDFPTQENGLRLQCMLHRQRFACLFFIYRRLQQSS